MAKQRFNIVDADAAIALATKLGGSEEETVAFVADIKQRAQGLLEIEGTLGFNEQCYNFITEAADLIGTLAPVYAEVSGNCKAIAEAAATFVDSRNRGTLFGNN